MKTTTIYNAAEFGSAVSNGGASIAGLAASVGTPENRHTAVVTGASLVGSAASFLPGVWGKLGGVIDSYASVGSTVSNSQDDERHQFGKVLQALSGVAGAVSVVVPQAKPVALLLSVANLGVELYEAKQKRERNDPRTRTGFEAARNHIQRRDPLMLDLDGDGIELLAADGRVQFDHDADGIRTGSGWVAGDDGLVVRDLNGNGTIDSGRELFGVDTRLANEQWAQDGFQALADLDSNSDGKFSASDTEFNSVRVWRDTSRDGISQAGELYTFAQLGISEINLVPTDTNSMKRWGPGPEVFGCRHEIPAIR